VSVSRFTEAALLALVDTIETEAAASPPDNNEEGEEVR
jgi:hypothetical protein